MLKILTNKKFKDSLKKVLTKLSKFLDYTISGKNNIFKINNTLKK